MLKVELISLLKAKRGIVFTALDFLYIVGSKAWEETFKSYVGPGYQEIQINSSRVEFKIEKPADLIDKYKDLKYLNDSGLNLYNAVMCYSFNSIYEFIEDYCELNTKNLRNWEIALWRPLARIIRNTFSHNFIIDFYNYRKKVMDGDASFTFPNGRQFVIKNNEHGKEITGDNLPTDVIILLIDEMISFAESL
jgi:hypothetical protein